MYSQRHLSAFTRAKLRHLIDQKLKLLVCRNITLGNISTYNLESGHELHDGQRIEHRYSIEGVEISIGAHTQYSRTMT